MSKDNNKPLKVVFQPGCFDNFDGSQEELDELIKLIEDQVASGEFFEHSQELDDVAFSELSDEEQEVILQALGNDGSNRSLN